MNSTRFYTILRDSFPFLPTYKQDIFFRQIAEFITNENQNEIFVLKGYAGTGKTTVISTIINHLNKINKRCILLAPTGRAAKVLSIYSKEQAFTIHKKIYFSKKEKEGGVSFKMQINKHTNTFFIIDESSMISDRNPDSQFFFNGSLLDDLVSYVYSGKGCKMILLGDTAQLPPVNMDVSPALNTDLLGIYYHKDIQTIELDEVMRQEENSGVLCNATGLRELLKKDIIAYFTFSLQNFKDIIRLSDGYDIQDAINDSYSNYSIEDTIFIVRSNKRANQYNQQIRTRILGKESDLSPGDFLMVVKNNYFWLKEDSESGFIANGDIIEVLELFGIQELYHYKFAKVKVRMVDYPGQKPFETVLLLDTIISESPSLTYEQSGKLYQEVLQDYENEKNKYIKFQKVKENIYFNALQVKFSYAITCHKSQGGQWDTVFVEKPYLPNGVDRDYVRWLYTAITRAKDKLYLIGFSHDDFDIY